MMVDEMGKRATSEGWEVGAWQRMDDATGEIEGLRRIQGADDLAKPSPGQVRVRCRLAEVPRVTFGESNELNRRFQSSSHDAVVTSPPEDVRRRTSGTSGRH